MKAKILKLLKLALCESAHKGEADNARTLARFLAEKHGEDFDALEMEALVGFDVSHFNTMTVPFPASTADIFLQLVGINVSEAFPGSTIDSKRFPNCPRILTFYVPKPELPGAAVDMFKAMVLHMERGWKGFLREWGSSFRTKKACRHSYLVGCAKGMSEAVWHIKWKEALPGIMQDATVAALAAALPDEARGAALPVARGVIAELARLGQLLTAPMPRPQAKEPEEPECGSEPPRKKTLQHESWAAGKQFGMTYER